VQRGWSLEHRKYYFSWLKDTLEKSGGQSFDGYVRAIREDAIDHLPPKHAAQVAWLLGDIATVDLDALPVPKGPPVPWTTDLAMKLFEGELKGRDFDNGKQMFAAGKCIACHRFQGSGGLCGPDLGSIAKRFSVRDIVLAICEPSHTISEQYHASIVTRKDGEAVFGRVIYRNDKEIAVAANPYDFSELTKTPIAEVANVEMSHVSMMPPATILMMSKEEVSDLMAYLLSGGNKRHKLFSGR
jgi:putative heme-binding domain-containing protein